MGSGAGDITNQLADIFGDVVGLEPNTHLRSHAEENQKSNASYVASNVVDYRTQTKFDFVFISYFLDTLQSGEYKRNLDALDRLIVDNGKIVGVTFLEDSDWNKYLNYVAGRMGIERKGGFVQISDRLSEFAWEIRATGSWRSSVSGSTVDHLYDALSFFVKARRSEYFKRRQEFLPKLQEVIYTNNRPWIEICEVIYEIRNVQR